MTSRVCLVETTVRSFRRCSSGDSRRRSPYSQRRGHRTNRAREFSISGPAVSPSNYACVCVCTEARLDHVVSKSVFPFSSSVALHRSMNEETIIIVVHPVGRLKQTDL